MVCNADDKAARKDDSQGFTHLPEEYAQMYRIGRISEYRACRGLPEALVMVLIYNHDWAAWIYRNGWWKGQ